MAEAEADFLERLGDRLLQVDPQAVKRTLGIKNVLDGLYHNIKRNERRLVEAEQKVSDVFPDMTEWGARLSPSLHFLRVVSGNMEHLVGGFVRGYRLFATNYHHTTAALEENGDPSRAQGIQFMRALQVLPGMYQDSWKLMLDVRTGSKDTLKRVEAAVERQSKYLQKRFVKSNEEKAPPSGMSLVQLLQDGPEDDEGEFVKIKLVNGNPFLTDVLLGVMDTLPAYRERTVAQGRKKKARVIKELSRHGVAQSVDTVLALSDPRVLRYVENPTALFGELVEAARLFYDPFERDLAPEHLKILEQEGAEILADAKTLRLLRGRGEDTKRSLERIASADFDSIVQRQDEYLPSNRKETDHFKLREELLTILYRTIKDLAAERTEDGPTMGEEDRAREAVMKAIALKGEITEVLASGTQRRLRQDRVTDNEYYEGRQGRIGAFAFEREPTPKVAMVDVVGSSFDRAKGHLREIIETGELGNLMAITAPSGKVKSNILLIGPYGCGKTELARAVCADARVIGASVKVTDVLTAYMHESVNNVGRVYSAARDLYREARARKPVALILDEFDGWFAGGEKGSLTDTDMRQIETVFLQVLDGMSDYNGIITVAMTNQPRAIPAGIMRRFRYVDVVGELSQEERAHMLQMYLEKRLPVHEAVQGRYMDWAAKLKDAPGDVVRKVVDEVHFSLMPQFARDHKREAQRIERMLQRREIRNGELTGKDIEYVRTALTPYVTVTPELVDENLDRLLKQPPIRMQIDTARRVYREARSLLEELSQGRGFGLDPKREFM